MTIFKEVVVIDDDGTFNLETEVTARRPCLGNITPSVERHRRSASVISTASSCTMKGDTYEEIESEPAKGVCQAFYNRPTKARSPTPELNHRKRGPNHDQAFRPRPAPTYASLGREVIDLSSDDEVNESWNPRAVEGMHERRHEHDINDLPEEWLLREVYGEMAPTWPSQKVSSRPALFPQARNRPVSQHSAIIDRYNQDGLIVKKDKTFELRDGGFIHIQAIIQNSDTAKVTVRGWELRRNRDMKGMFERKRNELCYVFDVDRDDSREIEEQAMIEVSVESLSVERDLIRTNKRRPKHPFLSAAKFGETVEETMARIRDEFPLYVRWKFIRVWPTAKDRLNRAKHPNRFITCRIVALTEKECIGDNSISPDKLRTQWRGKTALGGSANAKFPSNPGHLGRQNANSGRQNHPENEATDTEDVEIEREIEALTLQLESTLSKSGHLNRAVWEKVQRLTASQEKIRASKKYSKARSNVSRYTYGDTFSGGGGSTRGAKMAGLAIRYVMDGCAFCIDTLQQNFPEAKVYHLWSNDFVTLNECLMVDVLHISPPCQVWSPAHTNPGPDDDRNFASLFSVAELVSKIKPRIITLEQTFGIMAPRFEVPFNSLIHAFTSLGYSVSWQIVKLQGLGLPQSRQRLVMFAAGPGELLPEFPDMMYSDNPADDLPPYIKPRQVLQAIPRTAPNHNIAATYRGANYRGWDWDKLVGCITTGGGTCSGYPLGGRGMTDREYATMQGFPHYHRFYGMAIRKQIGNAVPPICAKIWFTHIREHLEVADAAEKIEIERRQEIERQRRRRNPTRVIDLTN